MKRILAALLALSLALSAGCAGPKKGEKQELGAIPASMLLARAEYPEMAEYPNEELYFDSAGNFDDEAFSKVYDAWRDDKALQREQYEGYRDGLDGFFTAGIREFLANPDGGNVTFSPLNTYMALALLAETTGGESREQILELLGSESIEALRRQAAAVWNANYSDDGALTSLLANSVWLSERIEPEQAAMKSLAENYYASSFSGEMGSEELNEALRSWINEQTGGLLSDQTDGLKLSPDTLFALASTVYFRAKWSSEFNEGKTQEGLFRLADAEETSVSCQFMHKSGDRNYYWGDCFSAVELGFEGGGKMKLILPDEGVSVSALLEDDEAMAFALNREDWEKSKRLIVNLAVPRFDISSELELKEGLMHLGVSNVFDPDASDFSPMLGETEGVWLDRVQHAARVTIDEEGCAAAAYTVMRAAGSAMPPDEEIDFVLDRPFVFVISSMDGLPLFVGVVSDPS